jgi:hypothetical protein
MWVRLSLLLVVMVAGGGCAHEYAYWPAGLGAGYGPAARYPFPPDVPRGEVYVTSFGFTEMDVAPGQPAQTLHARLAIVNAGPDTWTIDGQQQLLSVQHDLQPIAAAFVNTEGGPGPTYPIPGGQRRIVDLFFVVPPPFQEPKKLPWFELAWRIQVGAQAIGQRTVFQRFDGTSAPREPYPDYVFVGLGWGGAWWYGPAFPYARPPVIRSYYYPPTRARAYGAGAVPRAAPHGAPTPARPVGPAPRAAPAGPRAAPAGPRGGGGSWR